MCFYLVFFLGKNPFQSRIVSLSASSFPRDTATVGGSQKKEGVRQGWRASVKCWRAKDVLSWKRLPVLLCCPGKTYSTISGKERTGGLLETPWSEERAEATLSELRSPQASRERAVPDKQKKRVDYLVRYFPFAVEKTQKEPVKENRQPSSGLLDGKREIVEEIEHALRNKRIVPQKEMVLEHGKEQDFCVLEADSVVFLRRVRISDRLFSLLLQKTALKIGEDVGVFPSKKNGVSCTRSPSS
ncbi:MAG: uncharacterized protein A8A55_3092 [Amphiamblys sp. WSBS2006]|nr:MAG: uncharacterized protein A8A55_3092 [Amphiamblys sp. WSBS2006]